jgi:signal transduction histidine kinase
MTLLKSLIGKLTQVGLLESDPAPLRRKITFYNQFLLFCFALATIYAIVFCFEQNAAVSLICLWASVFAIFLLYLNSRRYFSYSMFLTIINSSLSALLSSFVMDVSSGGPIFFFVLLSFPIFLFSVSDRVLMFFSYAIILISFLMVWFLRGPLVFFRPFDTELPTLIFYSTVLSIFIFFIFLSYYYVRFEAKLARLLYETTTTLQKDNKSAMDALSHHERVSKLSLSIAHEIKNPVSAILATCELYRQEGVLDFDRFNVVVKTNIQRLLTVTNSMLSFGEVSFCSEEEFDINNAVEDTLYLVEPMTRKAGIEIIRRFSDLPMICLDTIRFNQVILNLIINAIEAMKDGGTLKISTMFVEYESGRSVCVVEIQDTGGGISEPDLERIFTSYVTMKKGNTGLGLFVVKQNMDYFKGHVSVRSDHEKGSVFTVQFPLNSEDRKDT